MNQIKIILFLVLILIVVSSCKKTESLNGASKNAKLHGLFEEEKEFNELQITSLYQYDGTNAFPDISPIAQQKRADFYKKMLEKLSKIDAKKLSTSDKISYDLFKFLLEDKIARIGFEDYLMPINAEGGFYTYFGSIDRGMLFEKKEDYDKYLAKLGGFKRFTEAHMELMRLGIKKGMTQPKVIMEKYKALIAPYMLEDPTQTTFYRPFKKFPASIETDTQSILIEQAKQIIQDSVLVTYKMFDKFMAEEYVPNCKTDLGATSLPNGKEYYEQRVQFYTTLPMSSDEIFELGKKEVARIRADMEGVIKEVEFKGDFSEFLTFLRTSPQFYAKTPKELLMHGSYLAKKMDGKLPQYFNTLPSLPYGVEPVPAEIAPNYTAGRYSGGSWKNHKAGNYWLNTYKLESRPLYVLPALTLHEAVPGHHLQISLANELTDLPEFRRNTYLSCFGEGWGLYSEYLGIEAGMYTTPYEHFGRMTYEMWRACRLVVDVGIHAKGWTREQAVEFLASNTALSLHEVNTEIDRYIGWAAQALSYKIGELKIRELRKKAEKELGDKFDIRTFHDALLKNSSVPLFVLEEIVEAHIVENK